MPGPGQQGNNLGQVMSGSGHRGNDLCQVMAGSGQRGNNLGQMKAGSGLRVKYSAEGMAGPGQRRNSYMILLSKYKNLTNITCTSNKLCSLLDDRSWSMMEQFGTGNC
jgi:hypothetical protein